MKLVYTFYHDNEGNLIKSDTKAIIKGKVFNCDLYDHFSRYAYIMTKVEKESLTDTSTELKWKKLTSRYTLRRHD